MTFVSYEFLLFMAVCLVLCRMSGRGLRPGLLFCASLAFLWLSGGVLSLAAYGFSAFTVWAGALGIERAGASAESRAGAGPTGAGGSGADADLAGSGVPAARKKRGIFLAVLLVNLAVLAAFKYVNFPGYTLRELAWLTGSLDSFAWTPLEVPAPAAISFYTLTLLGYLIEVYWGVEQAQKSFWRVALFGGFFPQMSTGPIVRWGEVSGSLFGPGRKAGEASPLGFGAGLDAADVFFGLRRVLWGLFKKLVIAERLGVVVDAVYGDYTTYTGSFLVLGAVCFAFQLYADFGGAADIAIGCARMFGVRLSENFSQPFYSRSIAEFWRRWHMTLGGWFKDFVMYPLLRTRAFERLGGVCRKRFGKKAGKRLTTAAALFVVWFLLGLWHGGMWTFIIGSGLYHAFLMSMALLAEPWTAGFYKKTGIDREHPLWIAWQRVRTFVLVTVGFVFFRSDSLEMAFGILRGMGSGDMGLFTREGFESLGLSPADWGVLAAGLLVLWAVSFEKERARTAGADVPAGARRAASGGSAAGAGVSVCWWRLSAVCAALAFGVLILGFYGQGYDAAAFIYAAF